MARFAREGGRRQRRGPPSFALPERPTDRVRSERQSLASPGPAWSPLPSAEKYLAALVSLLEQGGRETPDLTGLNGFGREVDGIWTADLLIRQLRFTGDAGEQTSCHAAPGDAHIPGWHL